MNVTDRLKKLDIQGRDFPILRGDVKMTLKNVHNGKTEVFEKHNLVTNALSDIFGRNFGGLVNYNNFADLYKTYLGGVLVFASALDNDATSYGIPALSSNAVTAHAGQTPLTSQQDDTTRGNPDDSAYSLTSSSAKLVWEWGTNAGNGTIASLGLTHTDVGSYGCGVKSTAQQSLNPFAEVACLSKNFTYGDSAECPLAINGNMAYNVYLANGTDVSIYKTPINNTKFKLQGGSLAPLTDYKTKVTATLPNSYNTSRQGYYYWFDFTNNKLVLFGVPTQGDETLYRDDIDLDSGSVTHSSITVDGAKLWKFTTEATVNPYDRFPTKAMVYNNHLFVYAYSTYFHTADEIFVINLANTSDQGEVDTTDFPGFNFCWRGDSYDGYHRINERFTSLGGIIVHRSFLINGDKLFCVSDSNRLTRSMDTLAVEGISSPNVSTRDSENVISVCKLYLATKWNLDNAVTKNASQSMTVEYTLTEV